MPWIAVDPSGSTVARRRCPAADLAKAVDHKVTAQDLVNKTQGTPWPVLFGHGNGPVDGGYATTAIYKALSVPCAASGRDAWKVSVSYWPYNPRTQWLWLDAASSCRSVHAAKDYFFVKQVQHGASWDLEC